MHYPETIRPALEVIGAHPKAGLVSGMYMLVFEKHVVFCADTTVNIDPTAEQLAQIAYRGESRSPGPSASSRGSRCCRSRTSARCGTPTPRRWRAPCSCSASAIRRSIVDGEMQADTAFDTEILAARLSVQRAEGRRRTC